MTKVYSLANVVVTIKAKNFNLTIAPTDAKHAGNISVKYANDFVSRESDAMGSSVYNENRDRGGSIDIDINQVSDYIKPLINYAKGMKDNLSDSLANITIKDRGGDFSFNCIDCLLNKIPDTTWGDTAGMRTFTFLTAKIDEN